MLNLCPWTLLLLYPWLCTRPCVPLGRPFFVSHLTIQATIPISKTQPLVLSQKKNNATWYPSLRQSHRPIPSPSLHSAELRSNCESLYARMKIPKSFKYQVLPVFSLLAWNQNHFRPLKLRCKRFNIWIQVDWMAQAAPFSSVSCTKVTKHFTIKSVQGRKVYNNLQILVGKLYQQWLWWHFSLFAPNFTLFFPSLFSNHGCHLSICLYQQGCSKGQGPSRHQHRRSGIMIHLFAAHHGDGTFRCHFGRDHTPQRGHA